MRIIGLFAAVVALIVGLAVAAPLSDGLDNYNRYQREKRSLELERQQRENDLWYERQRATQAGQIATDYLWRILALAAAGGGLWLAADAYRKRQARLDLDRRVIYPDARGFLPLPRALLEAGEPLDDAVVGLLTLYQQQRIAQAVHQPGQLPAQLNYSPSITHAPAQLTSEQPAAAALPDSGQPLPGLTDLADVLSTFRPATDRVLLALGGGGQPITVRVKQLCHVALVGATGGGKSNLLRLLLPQLQVLGAKIVLADPHFAPFDAESGEDWRPIASRLYMPPAVHAGQIADLLRWLCEQIELRKELRGKGHRVGRPLFLAFDELPIITEMVPDAMDAISRILREGRKFNILTVGASQDMLVKTIGGSSAVRDCYRTAFYVGGDVLSAARLLDLPQKQIDDGQLSTGLAMLRSTATTPARLVRVPEATNDAIRLLLPASEAASDPTSGGTSGETVDGEILEAREVGVEVGAEVGRDYPLPGQQDASNPRAERVRELLRQKAGFNEILRQVWSVEPSGRTYQQAAKELREIIAGLVGGSP